MSIFIHLVVLSFNLELKTKNLIPHEVNHKKIKVKLVEIDNRSIKHFTDRKKVKKTNSQILRSLGVRKFKSSKYFFGRFGEKLNINDSKQINSIHIDLFKRIDDRLDYPEELIIGNIQGIVNVRIYFNNTGVYRENRTKFYTNNPYLRVYTAQILRDALRKPIKIINKMNTIFYAIDTTFYFYLTTGEDQKNENLIAGKWLRFYRYGYGGDRIYDRIHKNIPKFSSILGTIWKNRPDFLKSEKKLVQEYFYKDALKKYKDDRMWPFKSKK